MQFIEIIKNSNWSDVERLLLSFYPEQLKNNYLFEILSMIFERLKLGHVQYKLY